MNTILAFIFFTGIFFIIHGIYDQKYKALLRNSRIEYRFIPRTYLEDQMDNTAVTANFDTLFATDSPWFERNVTLSKPSKPSLDKTKALQNTNNKLTVPSK